MSINDQSPSLPVVFNFGTQTIRTIDKDGEIWFVANDVCAALEVNNARQAVSRLDEDERDAVISNDAIGRSQEVTIINESGLYSLVLSSRKEQAKAFKRWVTRDVLPAIRKTGKYEAAGAPVMLEASKDESIDVRGLLLSGQSTPSVPLPPEVQKEVDSRAWAMAGEAFQLAREHLHRRIAYRSEQGYPQRHLNVEKALSVIREGGLCFALAHAYHSELRSVEEHFAMAKMDIVEAMAKLSQHRAQP